MEAGRIIATFSHLPHQFMHFFHIILSHFFLFKINPH
jgi:hypothetical protein